MNGYAPISEDDLHAFVDGRLSMARQAEVEAWFADHPESAAKAADYRAQRIALQKALAPILDAPVPSTLNLRTLSVERRRPRSLSRGWRAAAAALLLMVGGTGGWLAHGVIKPPARGIGLLAQKLPRVTPYTHPTQSALSNSPPHRKVSSSTGSLIASATRSLRLI